MRGIAAPEYHIRRRMARFSRRVAAGDGYGTRFCICSGALQCAIAACRTQLPAAKARRYNVKCCDSLGPRRGHALAHVPRPAQNNVECGGVPPLLRIVAGAITAGEARLAEEKAGARSRTPHKTCLDGGP